VVQSWYIEVYWDILKKKSYQGVKTVENLRVSNNINLIDSYKTLIDSHFDIG